MELVQQLAEADVDVVLQTFSFQALWSQQDSVISDHLIISHLTAVDAFMQENQHLHCLITNFQGHHPNMG